MLTAFLGIADTELDKDSPSLKNAYTDLSEKFRLIFRDEGNQVQNDFMWIKLYRNIRVESGI